MQRRASRPKGRYRKYRTINMVENMSEDSDNHRPTLRIRDIAHRAGVSTASVSRYLNQPDLVGPDLQRRIRQVIDETGYIPSANARALASRRTRTIGAIVPTVDNAMFARGLQALQSYLATEDYLLLLATNEYDLDVELKQARNLVARGVDALILRGDRRHPTLRHLLTRNHIPFVNVGVYEPAKPYPSIGVDNRAAGQALARYMLALGHRRIAIVAAHHANNDRAEGRLNGIRDRLRDAGCLPPPAWVLEINYNLSEASNAARALLREKHKPTAIICGNDVIAYGVMMSAIRLGIPVPDQLSVCGFDDLDWSTYLKPSLTTIHMPTDETWTLTGKYLVDTLAGRTPVPHQKLEFSLVVRESTAPPPGDPESGKSKDAS